MGGALANVPAGGGGAQAQIDQLAAQQEQTLERQFQMSLLTSRMTTESNMVNGMGQALQSTAQNV